MSARICSAARRRVLASSTTDERRYRAFGVRPEYVSEQHRAVAQAHLDVVVSADPELRRGQVAVLAAGGLRTVNRRWPGSTPAAGTWDMPTPVSG